MARSALPPPRNVDQAIDASPTLAALLSGHQRSQACFRLIQSLLTPPMRAMVRHGPIDEAGCWSLFAEHAAAASKLRQLLPTLLSAVAEREPSVKAIRVKILPADTHSPR